MNTTMDANTTLCIKTCDDLEVKVNRDVLQKFSVLVRTALENDKNVAELRLNVHSSRFNRVMEYIMHHEKKETDSPTPPVQTSWTIESAFEDKWDGEFFKRVIAEEDYLLLEFSRDVEYLDIDTLLRKTTVAITIGVIKTTGMDIDKLTDAFKKIDVGKRANKN